jgi:DME family drug/metabolite transporter
MLSWFDSTTEQSTFMNLYVNKGARYALLAAVLNATVGAFSTAAFSTGISSESIAFYKCLIAFGFLSLWMALLPKQWEQCKALLIHAHKIAVLALVGIFVLYYFETAAYQFTSIGTAVFTLQGASTITTFFGSQLILKAKHDSRAWFSMCLAIIGLFILYLSNNHFEGLNTGLGFAAIAGAGYGLFMVFNKKISLPIQGVPLLWWLLLFGSLFLAIPFCFEQHLFPDFQGWIYIACLALLGTIGGFYCTIKALVSMDAPKVQLFELSEPVFAALLGLIFFKQWLSVLDLVGGSFIFAAIFAINRS